MKKTVSLLMLLLVLGAGVFASNRIAVAVDPFTFQGFMQKNAEKTNLGYSKYGFGGSIGYSYEFGKGFVVGADIKVDTYLIKNLTNFSDYAILAKAGYSCKISEAFTLFANAKFGVDMQTYKGKASPVLEYGPELGASFKLNEKLDIFASCEGLAGFERNGEIKYAELRATAALGVGYAF